MPPVSWTTVIAALFALALAFFPWLLVLWRGFSLSRKGPTDATDLTPPGGWAPPWSWDPQFEVERLEVENNELRGRIVELKKDRAGDGPYRSPGASPGCGCPCTGLCGEGFGLGPDSPQPLSLQRGPGGVRFAGLAPLKTHAANATPCSSCDRDDSDRCDRCVKERLERENKSLTFRQQ